LFWIVIWIFCGFWILKGVLNILEFRFGWFLMIKGKFLFAISNLYGYIKCSRRLKRKFIQICFILFFFFVEDPMKVVKDIFAQQSVKITTSIITSEASSSLSLSASTVSSTSLSPSSSPSSSNNNLNIPK
jgi:hypothetical protein